MLNLACLFLVFCAMLLAFAFVRNTGLFALGMLAVPVLAIVYRREIFGPGVSGWQERADMVTARFPWLARLNGQREPPQGWPTP